MANSRIARPRIYLAGPEVFLPDAREVGRRKQAVCAEAGLDGVYPLDAELELGGLARLEQARRIALGNEGLMRSCDAIIANMTPFRGVSMDSGTAYEVGFMRALGKPVLGYTNAGDVDYGGRARSFRDRQAMPFDCDRPDHEIEDFGLVENLMIAVAVAETAGAVACTPAATDMTDLAAFSRCVARARALLLG